MKPKKKSTSHVTELKKRVKEKILGKAGGPSSTSQTKIPQGTDAPPVEYVRNPRYDELGPEADVKFVFHPKVVKVLYPKEAKKPAAKDIAPPTLAQNVLSRLTSKCPSSPSVIPKGTPIK